MILGFFKVKKLVVCNIVQENVDAQYKAAGIDGSVISWFVCSHVNACSL